MSIDTDTIVVRLTVSILLYQVLYIGLACLAYRLQFVYRHRLVVMVACCGIQRFRRTGELHDISRDEIVLDIEVVAPGLSIDEDMVSMIFEGSLQHQGVYRYRLFEAFIRADSCDSELSGVWHDSAYSVRRSGVLQSRLWLGFEGTAGESEEDNRNH